jgi:DNA-binding response OmpR family regulator
VRLSRLREMASDAGQPILVAEDEVSVLGFLVKVLTKHGYQVQTATRGDDAIAMIRKHHPKLVLLDVLMPGIDGKDICKRMRADADMADIPVILMSALDAVNLHAIAAETGASDYICKPVSMADLLTMVGKYAVP